MNANLKWFAMALLFGTCTSVAPSQTKSKPLNEETVTLSTKQDGIMLSVVLPKKCVAGAPITLTCVIANQGKEPVRYFNYYGGFEVIEINIVDSRGKDIPVTRFGFMHRRVDGGQNPTRELLPGEKRVIVMPLARLRDLTVAGSYTLTIRRDINETKDRPIGLLIKDIKIQVEEPKN